MNFDKNVITRPSFILSNIILIIVLGTITYRHDLLNKDNSQKWKETWIIENLSYTLFSFFSIYFILNLNKLNFIKSIPIKMKSLFLTILSIIITYYFGILAFSKNIFKDYESIKTKIIKTISHFLFIYSFVWYILENLVRSFKPDMNQNRTLQHFGMFFVFTILISLVVMLNFNSAYNSDVKQSTKDFIQRFGLFGIVMSILIMGYYMGLDITSLNKKSMNDSLNF